MEYDVNSELFYAQYDCDYSVKGNVDNVKEADRVKLNLYFSPAGSASAITTMQCEISEQCAIATRLAEDETQIADSAALSRQLGMLSLTFSEDGSTLKNFCVNTDRRDMRLRTSGYFACRDAHDKVHRAQGQNEIHHSLCRQSGRDLQGVRL